MSKKVVVIYDDTHKPSKEIASITGGKSFGETIFKRKSLKERMFDIFSGFDSVDRVISCDDEVLKLPLDEPVVLIYSDFGVIDKEQAGEICLKAGFAHENYKVTLDGKIVMLIFSDAAAFKSADANDFSGYTEIKTSGFVDLSDVTNFRTFITSGFEARFFNSLSGDEYTLVKESDNVKKLYAEYSFYELLPEEMKQWFVRPFGFEEKAGRASYKMQRYHMTDLAIRYVHGAIGMEEFRDILTKLFYFLSIRKKESISREEYEKEAKRLYLEKVSERIENLKKHEGYGSIAAFIKSGTDYENIDEIFEKYEKLYDSIREKSKFQYCRVCGHGDMCFSNILYSRDTSLLLFIDVKGATKEEELYMDPFYDIAKLSHSVCGLYDFFNSDLYEICIDENLRTRVNVNTDNRAYVEVFKEFLNNAGIDFRLVRLYEASLFLSMLPLHMDRPKKVFAFILNAIDILESL